MYEIDPLMRSSVVVAPSSELTSVAVLSACFFVWSPIATRSACPVALLLTFTYRWLVSDSAPTWSSRCSFTACHF